MAEGAKNESARKASKALGSPRGGGLGHESGAPRLRRPLGAARTAAFVASVPRIAHAVQSSRVRDPIRPVVELRCRHQRR